MSKQYENDIAKRVHRQTDGRIRSYRCGYSGSNAMPQPDVLVADASSGLNHAAEIKGPIASDTLYVEPEDLEQIVACQNSNTRVYLVVKFQRREALVVRYFGDITGPIGGADEYEELSIAEKFEVLVPDAFDARVTDGGNLGISKPSTDDWPSAKAGSSDVDAILSGFAISRGSSVQLM